MERRSFIAALALAPAGPLVAQEAQQPRYKLSAEAIGDELSARFPMRFGIPGIAQVELSEPRLLLFPRRDRVGTSVRAVAGGSGIPGVAAGTLDVAFALRYERRDRSIRAFDPEIMRIDWPALTADAQQAVQMLIPQAAREMAAELVLHRFSSRELALTDTMGFEPQGIRVADDGVVVEFREKDAR